MNNLRTKIGVLGAGSWGTVLSEIVSSNGYEILLWSRNKNTVDEINNKHTNKRGIILYNMPKVKLILHFPNSPNFYKVFV